MNGLFAAARQPQLRQHHTSSSEIEFQLSTLGLTKPAGRRGSRARAFSEASDVACNTYLFSHRGRYGIHRNDDDDDDGFICSELYAPKKKRRSVQTSQPHHMVFETHTHTTRQKRNEERNSAVLRRSADVNACTQLTIGNNRSPYVERVRTCV